MVMIRVKATRAAVWYLYRFCWWLMHHTSTQRMPMVPTMKSFRPYRRFLTEKGPWFLRRWPYQMMQKMMNSRLVLSPIS